MKQKQALKKSILTAGVVLGATAWGSSWQTAQADVAPSTKTTARYDANSQNDLTQAQVALKQAQDKVDEASKTVTDAQTAQTNAQTAAQTAQSEYVIAHQAAQAQMPSAADQAKALNGTTIDIKNATLDMFNNQSSDPSANVKNQIGEANVTENWQWNPVTNKYDLDPTLANALTVRTTPADEATPIDITNLSFNQQQTIANFVGALINQLRDRFGLHGWVYNDITLKQALAIVNHAYNEPNWNVNIKGHNIPEPDKTGSNVFDVVTYNDGEKTDSVQADMEAVGLISADAKQPDVVTKIVKTMGDLKRAATVAVWDMLFNDAHANNSHARALLNGSDQYMGVAVDKYGALHIYGLVPSYWQKVSDTQSELASANKALETGKLNLSQAQAELQTAQSRYNQVKLRASLVATVDQNDQATASKSQLQGVTVKTAANPTQVTKRAQGDSPLLTTSKTVVKDRSLPQTGNLNSTLLASFGMLLSALGLGLGLKKRRA